MADFGIPTPTTVTRIYGDCPTGELLAVFAYHTDALAFAQADVGHDPNCFLVVANSYDGRVTIVRVKAKEISDNAR